MLSMTERWRPLCEKGSEFESSEMVMKRKRAQEFWGQLQTVSSFLDGNGNQGGHEPLPEGPWDGDAWEARVLVPALGPSASGGKKKYKMRSLLKKPDAWRLLRDLARLLYYQDEDVLPFDMLDLMHEDVGIKCNGAGYMSTFLAPWSLG